MHRIPIILLAAAAALGSADSGLAASPEPLKIALASPAKGGAPAAFAGTRLTVGTPATSTRTTLSLPAGTATLGATSRVALEGSLTFTAGARRATVTRLTLVATAKGLTVSGRTGGRTVTVLTSRTGTAAKAGAAELKLRRAALKLAPAGATRLGRQLRRTLRPGTTLGVVSGTLRTAAAAETPAASGTPTTPGAGPSATAPAPAPPTTTTPASTTPTTTTPTVPTPPPFTGPFAEACLSQQTFGALTPESVGVPTLPGSSAATSATLTWDLRPSFVDYVGMGGRVATWNGATYTAGSGFTFTFESATVDGTRTVAQFRGRIDFCYPDHYFRIALADPIVVIDGGQPRIIMTGDSYQGVPPTPATQIQARRVVFATFTDPGSTLSATTRTWTVPASPGTKLTTEGADIANATSSPGSGLWGKDLPFGGFTLRVTS